MSWEVFSDKEHKCPCGYSTYRELIKTNDWGQNEEEVTMNCPDCRGKYVQKYYQTSDGGENWRWELKTKAEPQKEPIKGINEDNLFIFKTIKEKD